MLTDAQIDGMTDALTARLAPAYRAAVVAEAEGDSSAGALWTELAAELFQAAVKLNLLGVALERRRMVKLGHLEPVPPGQPYLTDGQIQFASGRDPVSIVRLAFLAALNAFRDDVPDLVNWAQRAATVGRRIALGAIGNERGKAVKFIDALLKRETGDAERIGTLGGIGVKRGAAAEAIATTLGVDTAQRRLSTEVRTAMMHAFGEGQRAQIVAAPGAYLAFELSEIRDRRTRGNPNGLYPDAGPHFQMDGFAAPADDPVWDAIWTPNGWNCRGGVRGLTVDECGDRGWLEGDGLTLDRDRLRAQKAAQWRILAEGRYPDPGFGGPVLLTG